MTRRRLAAAVLVLVFLAGAFVAGFRGGGSGPAAAADAIEIHSVHGASFLPALQGQKPLFVLVLGSDARGDRYALNSRGDSIHIIGIDRTHDRATILGFPRDSWVPIPGHGTGKITTALTFGGPQLMAQTLENLTGIHIDFWVLTTFHGLTKMVNAIGGLTVNVPQNLDDKYSGAHIKAGLHHLRGGQVLAFARDRHDFGTGDLARSANQGMIMLAALHQLQRAVMKDPTGLLIWITAAWRNVHTDLPIDVVLDLALAAAQVPEGNVNNLVVPATTGSVGGASVVFISSSAQSVYADMRANGVVGR